MFYPGDEFDDTDIPPDRFHRNFEKLSTLTKETFQEEDSYLSNCLELTDFVLDLSRVHKEVVVSEGSTVIPGHLNTPITCEDQEAILSYDSQNMRCFRHRTWKFLRESNTISDHVYSSSTPCSPYICLKTLVERISEPSLNSHHVTRAKTQLVELWDIAMRSTAIKKYNFERSARDLLPPFNEYEENFTRKFGLNETDIQILLPIYLLKLKAEYVKDLICNKKIKIGFIRCPHPEMVYDKETILFKCSSHSCNQLAPLSLLICVLDIFQAKFPIYMSWTMDDKLSKYGILKIRDRGNNVWKTFEKIRDSKVVSKFFDFLGTWESLMVAYVIKDPKDEGCTELYDELMSTVPEQVRFEVTSNLLPQTYTLDETRMYLELTGLSKSFGHPCIDMKTSLNVVREFGGKYIDVNYMVMDKVKAKIIEIFCKQYFQKHHRYPPIENNKDKISKIMIEDNRPITRSDNLTYKDYLRLRFKKTFEFDYNYDTSTFIKDSASSPPMSAWASSFDYCAFYQLYNKPGPRHKFNFNQTRVILNFLQGNKDDIRKKIEDIEQGFHDPEHAICSYCRKERELKEDGRVFVKQCYCQRLLQVLREFNISTYVYPYFDDQTMTNTETQVLKKQELLSQTGANNSNIIINIDLSKWNLHFRDRSVRPIGAFLDELFGLKRLYKESHRWFLNCKIFCNSRLCPPDFDEQTQQPLPGPFFIDNHLGGGEGMCQKLWTLINIGVIRLTADELNININVMGQGDNQVVIIKLRKDQLDDRVRIRQEFMGALDQNFKSIGLKLKLKETWYSTRLFEYGKQRYLDGIAVSSQTKKIARLIPDINDGITSIQSCLAQINTTTEGACKTEYSATVPFLINQFETLNYLTRLKIVSRQHTRTDKERFLFFPTILGGFPSSLFFNCTVRGNDDPLPQWLCLLQDLKIFRPELYKKVIKIVDLRPNQKKNYDLLFMDIRSLNLRPLVSTETFVKESTLEFLKTNRDIVKNSEITSLFDPQQTIPLNTLTEILKEMKPMLLPLAHEILRLSNAGILLSLQRKMTKVSTITQIVMSETGKDFFTHSLFLQQLLIIELNKRVIENPRDYLNFLEGMCCPSRLSTYLRIQHWGLDLLAPTKPTQNHQFRLIELDKANDADKTKGIIITVSKIFRTANDLGIMIKGPCDSYIGNKTKEKLIEPTISLSSRPPEVVSYQSLYSIKSWFKMMNSPNMDFLITSLMREKSPRLPLELQELDDDLFCPTVKGGNIVHRLKASVEKRVGIRNTNPSIGSHFSFSTNNMTYYNKGGKDYTIHFQNAYHSAEALIINLKLMGIDVKSQYVYRINCEHCTEDVTDENIELRVDPRNELVVNYNPQNPPPNDVKIIDTKDMGDEIELRQQMSVLIGRLVGRSYDLESYRSYYLTEVHSMTETGRLANISTYFIKTVDFNWMLVGVLYESNLFKTLISKLSSLDKLMIDSESCTKFCSMLIEGGRALDFLSWTGLDLTTHGELLDPRVMSKTFLRGLLYKYTEMEREVMSCIFQPIFSNDSLHKLQTIVDWIYKRQKIIKIPENLSIIVVDPKKRGFQIPDTSFLSDSIIRHKDSHLEEITRRSLISCISPKFYTYRNYESTLVLPSYKSINTLETASNSSTLMVRDIAYLDNPDYSFDILQNLIHSYSTENHNAKIYKIPYIQHFSRIIGSISTAATKYLEILILMKIKPRDKPNLNLHLAEGSGSVCWLFSHYFNTEFSYNTLMDPDIDNRRHQELRIPPACASVNTNTLYLNRFKPELSEGETDILSTIFIEKFKRVTRFESRVFVTIDAESTTSASNFAILRLYSQLMMDLTSIKLLICKVLISHDINWSSNLIEILEEIIHNTEVSYSFCKPVSSHPCNGEIFVVLARITQFSQEIQSSFSTMRSIFNNAVISIFPQHAFSARTLRQYLSTSSQLKSLLTRQVLSLNPSLYYYTEYSRSISLNMTCGISCLSWYKWAEERIALLTGGLSSRTELMMDVLSRRTGTIDTLIRTKLQSFFCLLFLSKTSPELTNKDVIFIQSIQLAFPNITHNIVHLTTMGGGSPLFKKVLNLYEEEGIKNFYRYGNKCGCKLGSLPITSTLVEFLLLAENSNWPYKRLENWLRVFDLNVFQINLIFEKLSINRHFCMHAIRQGLNLDSLKRRLLRQCPVARDYDYET